jgi:hypothetical protein
MTSKLPNSGRHPTHATQDLNLTLRLTSVLEDEDNKKTSDDAEFLTHFSLHALPYTSCYSLEPLPSSLNGSLLPYIREKSSTRLSRINLKWDWVDLFCWNGGWTVGFWVFNAWDALRWIFSCQDTAWVDKRETFYRPLRVPYLSSDDVIKILKQKKKKILKNF